MSEQEESSNSKPKKLSLRLPEPMVVDTTRGPFKTRHVGMGDLKTFAPYIEKVETATDVEREELGKLALLTLVSSADNQEAPTALTEDVLS
jgi:hypothetical protein